MELRGCESEWRYTSIKFKFRTVKGGGGGGGYESLRSVCFI